MLRLTFRRKLDIPLIAQPRDALIRFYTAPHRNWSLDKEASSVFSLKFRRGNWSEPFFLKWLAGTPLSRFFAWRRPGKATGQGAEIDPRTCPAELTLIQQPRADKLELSLTYVAVVSGHETTVHRLERMKWKSAVETDLEELLAFVHDAANIVAR